MAWHTQTRTWTDSGISCYFGDSHGELVSYLDSITWGRDTSNCERSVLTVTMNMSLHVDSLVWIESGSFYGNWIYTWAENRPGESHNTGNRTFNKPCNSCASGQGCCCCVCNGFTIYYSDYYGWFKPAIVCDVNTKRIGHNSVAFGETTGDAYYSLPNQYLILPPNGLNANWPSNWEGSISATLSTWSANSNIGGTPTSYPNRKIWNFAFDLLDANGNYLAHQWFCTNETKSVTSANMKTGWYTANALSGTTEANNSKYTLEAGKTYKFRVVANNNMNQQISTTSNNYVFNIPTPTCQIDSFVYDRTDRVNKLTFSWSKAISGLDEKITYTVKQGSTVISSGTLVEHTNGQEKSGTMTISGIPSGELTTLTIVNASIDGSQSKSATTSAYAPVTINAVIGYEWDDVRRVCRINAETHGAANCRIQAGYSANSHDIADVLNYGEYGEVIVQDLNHGNGQILYLQAIPESSDGHQFTAEAAKVSVKIPNPILGVATKENKKQYIVDVIEHKKNNSVTPKWKNGQRIVKK